MIVFGGPSLAGQRDADPGHIDIRGPVRQGDVYLATLERPLAIGIIDGYFEGVPSVWHKEILWAMSQGVAVFGAASMGALRAAELDAFGMIGIGAIYEAYRDGQLEDDDEVALVHGPEELDYVALSVAMVNVRATCKAAVAAGVVTDQQADRLVAQSKAQFYKTRTWESIFLGVDREFFPQESLETLRQWIDDHEVDQKRDDAQALLDHLARGDIEIPAVDFHFEQTDLWVRTTDIWQRRRRQDPVQDEAGYHLLGDIGLLR